MTYQYAISCVDSTARWIWDMIEVSHEVTYGTMAKRVGTKQLKDLFPYYDWGPQRGGLRLKNDWHVGYYRSVYRSKPCYYVQHSGIEYIFTQE